MSTVDHILAACGSLRNSWRVLADATVPGRTRCNQRALTESATAKRDNQARQERADRAVLADRGTVLAGNSHAPANISALDARRRIADDVNSTAWRMASGMRNRGYNDLRQRFYNPDATSDDAKFTTAVDWISTNAVRLQPGDQATINDTYKGLNQADTLARAVLGEGPALRRMSAPCPACGLRSLAWNDTDRPEEAHILCTSESCTCQGRDCACRIPDRQHGMTHLWTSAAWERLATQLRETT